MEDKIYNDAIGLLSNLIRIESFSGQEALAADCMQKFLIQRSMRPQRYGNNIVVYNIHFDENKPSLVLNSHLDTVKPNASYTRDPFHADTEDGKMYGLGSNDAGGPLVSLLSAFRILQERDDLPINLIFIASAEEENSGKGGIESVFSKIPVPDLAIVGEPTLMRAAVSEKGLLVIDGLIKGKAGHAARNEGENAISKALPDIQWFNTYKFPKVSDTLGEVNMNLTVLKAGELHNTVPDVCTYTVDIRLTDSYTHEEVLDIIRANVIAEITPRSIRLKPSLTPVNHPVRAAAQSLGMELYGSPTMSDQALMPFPSIKIGPGDSARSHTANEFIYLDEIKQAIPMYVDLIKKTYQIS
ncbi:MAG: M20/M25/M40 family metallo-hydrolase [Bacteroidota bacterium]